MGATILNEAPTTELPIKNRQQPKPLWEGLNAFYWYQITRTRISKVTTIDMIA